MEPAALGTARIGLDRIRREHEIYDLGDGSMYRRASRHASRRPVGRLVAAALRAAAARLDPAPTPAREPSAAASSL